MVNGVIFLNYMINLLVNIPDNNSNRGRGLSEEELSIGFLNILKQNLQNPLINQNIYVSFINYENLNKSLVFIEQFKQTFGLFGNPKGIAKQLYKDQEQRQIERKTIYKTLYRRHFPLDIVKTEINKYI